MPTCCIRLLKLSENKRLHVKVFNSEFYSFFEAAVNDCVHLPHWIFCSLPQTVSKKKKQECLLWVSESRKKSLMFLRMMNKSTKQSGNTSRWQQRLFVFSRAVITIPGTNQGAYQLRTCMNRFILMYMRRCKE